MHQSSVDYSRKWHIMAAVAMGIFQSTIDGSIVNIALPTIAREIYVDFVTVQWVVLSYLLTVTTLMLSVGRLADMVGKKPLYIIGFITFTSGSALCSITPDIAWLIGFRVLQGFGAALLMALGAAIVTEAFPPTERGQALGISGLMVSIGIVIGPTLGGLLIDLLSWRWIFFVNVPVGILGTLMVIHYVPDIRPDGKQRFDFVGASALGVCLLSFLLALTLGQRSGFGHPQPALLFANAIFTLVLFILIERNSPHPIIALELFQTNLFTINLISGFISFILIAGSLFLMPFYLEHVSGYTTRQIGLLLATVPIALGISAPISGWLSDRSGSRPMTVVGLLVLLIGYYTCTTLNAQTTMGGYILRFVLIGIGTGIFQSPNNSAIMGTALSTQLGVVSGLLATMRTLGQMTGIAVLGAVWAGRIMVYTGNATASVITTAPISAQVVALQDTFMVGSASIALALILSGWGLVQERWTGFRHVQTELRSDT